MSHRKTSLSRIRMTLARTRDFPEGSQAHGYEFVAPLTGDGHIDAEEWRANRNACTATRFWGDEPPQHGRLVHRAGGADGATWGFDYDRATQTDDEAGFRFGDHAFAAGEYVSIRDSEGEMHPFRIASVRPA